MNDVLRSTGFVTDARLHLADGAPLVDRPFFVALARFRAERDTLVARGRDVGVELEPSDRLDDLAADLGVIGAVAIRFPKFGDGRGYSLARLLRDRHGFTGELRAVGDVLWDQIEALFRVGFDTLEVADPATRARLARGERPIMPVRYQPDGTPAAPLQSRPWVSRVDAD